MCGVEAADSGAIGWAGWSMGRVMLTERRSWKRTVAMVTSRTYVRKATWWLRVFRGRDGGGAGGVLGNVLVERRQEAEDREVRLAKRWRPELLEHVLRGLARGG